MEIILKENIDTLGFEGDIVNVKPGYARNYLFPQKKAVPVNKETLARLKREQEAIAARREAAMKQAEGLAKRLESQVVTISRRVGDEDRLFGSVSSKDIADELQAMNIEIDKRAILLSDPIKSLGEVKVQVKVGYQMTSALTVRVVAEGREDEVPAEEENPAVEAAEAADTGEEATTENGQNDESGVETAAADQ